ncbi:Signal peptidase I [hydrothermal vent metagenome]|uniref:signal peptidase I n=1 Tax=hydrothermal vent metagenome TaxID=652676 RepID=A0A3B1AXX0_9ZZZZ
MKRLKLIWIEWRSFFVFIALMFVFRSAIADWYEVPTGSMKPTIIEGDRVFVNKLAYDLKIPFTLVTIASWGNPVRGDVIVFDSLKENKRLIKRVIGEPNDVIEMVNNQVYINSLPAVYSDTDQSLVEKYWDNLNSFTRVKPILYKEHYGNNEYLITVLKQGSNQINNQARNFGPYQVPENKYFVLGDNRDNSADSRFIGAIDRKYILGQANKIVFSTRQAERFFLSLN